MYSLNNGICIAMAFFLCWRFVQDINKWKQRAQFMTIPGKRNFGTLHWSYLQMFSRVKMQMELNAYSSTVACIMFYPELSHTFDGFARNARVKGYYIGYYYCTASCFRYNGLQTNSTFCHMVSSMHL